MNAAVALEAKNLESGARSQEQGVGGQEGGAQNMGFGYRKPVVGGSAVEARGQKPEASIETSEDVGEDAEVATATEGGAISINENVSPPPSDDEGYNWPEGAEAATEAATPAASAPEAVVAPLPSLDELIQRIPTDIQDTLESLFRVKFVSVKRVSPTVLKS